MIRFIFLSIVALLLLPCNFVFAEGEHFFDESTLYDVSEETLGALPDSFQWAKEDSKLLTNMYLTSYCKEQNDFKYSFKQRSEQRSEQKCRMYSQQLFWYQHKYFEVAVHGEVDMNKPDTDKKEDATVYSNMAHYLVGFGPNPYVRLRLGRYAVLQSNMDALFSYNRTDVENDFGYHNATQITKAPGIALEFYTFGVGYFKYAPAYSIIAARNELADVRSVDDFMNDEYLPTDLAFWGGYLNKEGTIKVFGALQQVTQKSRTDDKDYTNMLFNIYGLYYLDNKRFGFGGGYQGFEGEKSELAIPQLVDMAAASTGLGKAVVQQYLYNLGVVEEERYVKGEVWTLMMKYNHSNLQTVLSYSQPNFPDYGENGSIYEVAGLKDMMRVNLNYHYNKNLVIGAFYHHFAAEQDKKLGEIMDNADAVMGPGNILSASVDQLGRETTTSVGLVVTLKIGG